MLNATVPLHCDVIAGRNHRSQCYHVFICVGYSRNSAMLSAITAVFSYCYCLCANVRLNVHSPSVSCSRIISRSSSRVGFMPRLFITVPSSSNVIRPLLSLSKSSKAARNSMTRSLYTSHFQANAHTLGNNSSLNKHVSATKPKLASLL